MPRTLRGTLMLASVLSVAFVGCNAILDNRPGTLAETEQPGGATPGATDAGGAAPADERAREGASLACPAGQQRCSDECVSSTDPLHGCGDPSCEPCPSTGGAMGCDGNTCVAADVGCDAVAPLRCGAECIDPLTSTNHCGACNVMCPAVVNATATCAEGECSFTCGAPFHLCAGTCVPRTDATRCGADCKVCPVPPGGAATCVADTCSVACAAGLRVCNGSCTTATDPTACGPACAVCPAAANATATCVADVCARTCNPGFADCDASPANGCETQLATDASHCGTCGQACRLPAVCMNGSCLL